MAPKLENYNWGSNEIILGIHGCMQHMNASLALQLCNIWLRDHAKSKLLISNLISKSKYLGCRGTLTVNLLNLSPSKFPIYF